MPIILRVLYPIAKRILDILFSLFVLILSAPILVIIAVLVKATSKGPVFYRAVRVGELNRDFKMIKFRTMVNGADRVGPSITASDDSRITPLGHFLRLSKLDEIPQFWNVLIGDMSVVGPRPNVRKFVDRYAESELQLLTVPQGITDLASLWFRVQEKELEGSADPESDYASFVAPTKVALGLYYAENRNFGLDLKVIVATFAAIFLKVDPTWCFPAETVQMVRPTSRTANQEVAA